MVKCLVHGIDINFGERMRKIKINILSPVRFHVLDLARELDKNGFDVRFYSFVPVKRAIKFGLPRNCSKSVIAFVFPFLLLSLLIFKKSQWLKRLLIIVLDYVTGIYMRRCDICIAMSGNYMFSIRRAKKRGAIVILERGSKHILEQKRILDSLKDMSPQVSTVPDFNLKRELAGYEIADYISIPSEHVKRSFTIHHHPNDKIFLNSYGVDVTMFHPSARSDKKYDLIMVGGWSLRKGCDILVESVRKINMKLLHVGRIVDLPFPDESQFTHVDPVDESLLRDYYNQAKVFVLPSREEGLALVQAQAIACNLPIVGSPDSGAEDLTQLVEFPENIAIIKDYTVDAVIDAIYQAMQQYEKFGDIRYAGKALQHLTWEAYGKRYSAFLNSIFSKNTDGNRI